MSSPGDRGKVAEGLVTKALDKRAQRYDFDYERIYDARSSRGKMTVERTGDFQAWRRSKAYAIEVKEVDHMFRLPRANFSQGQRARMVKRHLTGCEAIVLIYFTPTKMWRLAPIGLFGSEATGSWDFSSLPLQALEDILSDVFGEKSETTNAPQ